MRPASSLEQDQAAFDQQLPDMLRDHAGEYAVFHDSSPAGFFSSYDDAYAFALDHYGIDAVFLISQVIPRNTTPASISWYAGVMFG